MKTNTTMNAFNNIRKETAKASIVMKDKSKYNRKAKHKEKF